MLAASEHNSAPDEIFCKIFSFSNPIDIIRARLVSKRIRNITYDRELWEILYANARFPRPPGPFPSQSTQVLERILVRSARLAETWTTQPMEEVSCSETRLGLLQRASPRLVCGRWIITCEQNSKIVSHDTTRTALQQVIWEVEDGGTINFWESCSITSVEGESVYVVVFGKPAHEFLSQSLLLEFRVNGDSLEFYSSLDIPAGAFNSTTGILSDKGPFLYIQGLRLIFDTRTRIFYMFPDFSSHLHGIDATTRGPPRVFLTGTHVIGLTSSTVGGLPNSMLIQAFIPPSHSRLSPAGVGILQLTHECVSIHESMSLMTLIRDSTVDPLTGATNMRFIRRHIQNRGVTFRCIDFTLPKPCDETVLPISFGIRDIVTISGLFSPTDPVYDFHFHVDSSIDGYVRGYYRGHRFVYEGSTRGRHRFITKFTIDANQDRCQAVVGETSMPYKESHVSRPVLPAWFDGVRGRVCYGTGPMDGIHGYDRVYVVDIR